MYESFFGLREKPFNLTPDPRYFYFSESHKEALSALIYGVRERVGLVCLTGPVGVGKTMVLASFLDHVGEYTEAASFFGGNFENRLEFLRDLCRKLGISPGQDSISGLSQKIRDFAIQKTDEGRSVVVLVDEAQDLTVEELEHFHQLCNLETLETKLVQIVLAGTEKLEEKLRCSRLEALWQRVAIRCVVEPIQPEETIAYIFHRMHIAGGSAPELFSEEALFRIVNSSGGLPRLINLVCNQAMISAFSSRKLPVGEDAVREALEEMEGAEARIETGEVVSREEFRQMVERVYKRLSEQMPGLLREEDAGAVQGEDRSRRPQAVGGEGLMMWLRRRWGLYSWFRPGRKLALSAIVILLLAMISVVTVVGLLKPGTGTVERVVMDSPLEPRKGLGEETPAGEAVRDEAPRGGPEGEVGEGEISATRSTPPEFGRAGVEQSRKGPIKGKTGRAEQDPPMQRRITVRDMDLAGIALEHYGRLDLEILRMLKESNPQIRDWNRLEGTDQFVLPDVPEARDGGANFFTIQVGAFNSKKGASKQASDLAKRGVQNLFLVKGERKGLILVCVGVFESGAQSSGGIKRMQEWGFADAFPTRIRAKRLEDILQPYDGRDAGEPRAAKGDEQGLLIGRFPLVQE